MSLDLTQFTGHTPGPWRYEAGLDWSNVFAANGCNVAHCQPTKIQTAHGTFFVGPDGAAANSRLIASAPDLLSELTSARERIGRLEEAAREAVATFFGSGPLGLAVIKAMEELRAALNGGG